jgi:hypothetical protein
MMGSPIPPLMPMPQIFPNDPLTKDQKLMELLETYHPIASDDDSHPEKLTWCLEHCQGKFRDIRMGDGRVWYFQNDQDATLFALKWA